jgi:DNA polymerase-3 subunit gamma/tau
LRAGFIEAVLPQLRGVAKAIFSTGDFVAVTADGAVFALENSPTRDRAERSRSDVEAALANHFGSPVPLILIDKADSTKYGGSAPPSSASGSDQGPRTVRRPGSPELTADEQIEAEIEDPRAINISELDNADDVAETGIDRLTRAFPGAKLIEVSEEKT